MVDLHKCPTCGKTQVYYVDTWLCPDCDWKVIWDLYYEHNVRKGKI